MADRTIFIISGREAAKEKISPNFCNVTEEWMGSDRIYKSALHLLSILGCCGLMMSILTLIPRHNAIVEQSYWLEIMFPAGICVIIITAAIAQDFFVLTGKHPLVVINFFLKIGLTLIATWVTTFSICYIIWTMILEYNHPIPFLGTICLLSSTIFGIVSGPVLMPSKFFEEEGFKRKLKDFMLYESVWIMVAIVNIC